MLLAKLSLESHYYMQSLLNKSSNKHAVLKGNRIMHQALLVIDYIVGIAETGTCAAFLKKRPEIIENTNKVIESFRQFDLPIFFIRLAFDENHQELPKYAPNATHIRNNKKFLLDTPETEFISTLNFRKGDLVFNKKYGNPFYKSGITDALVKFGIDEIVLTGIATDNAIIYGANHAMELNYKVTLISDACGAQNQENHDTALAIMEDRVVNEIPSTEQFLATY